MGTEFEVVSVTLLLGLLISGAVVIWARRVVSAVVASAAAGVFLMLIFFYLRAPDVALAEVVVSAIAIPMIQLVSIAKIRTLLDDTSEAE